MRSNVLLSIVATLVALVVFEFGLKQTGIYLTHSEKNSHGGLYFSRRQSELLNTWFWVHQPNDTFSYPRPEFKFNRTTNSLGLSDSEWIVNDSSYVILGIGDSFTEGVGVDADSTWLKTMEYTFQESVSFPVKTMNGGIGGSDPVFGYLLFEQKLRDYKPEMVILSLNSSDILEMSFRGGFERFKEDGTTGRAAPEWEYFYQHSHLIRFVVHTLLQYNRVLIKESEARRNREKFVPIVDLIISKIDSLSYLDTFKYLIVVHPIPSDFQSNGYFDEEMNELIESMKAAGTPYLDIREKLISEGYGSEEEVKSIYWPIDMHFNKKGYKLYAKYVARKIENDFLNTDSVITTQKHPQPSLDVH